MHAGRAVLLLYVNVPCQRPGMHMTTSAVRTARMHDLELGTAKKPYVSCIGNPA